MIDRLKNCLHLPSEGNGVKRTTLAACWKPNSGGTG